MTTADDAGQATRSGAPSAGFELPDRLVVIGHVRSPWRQTHDIPLQGGPAAIEIDAAFGPALDHIERSSHVVVLAFLHKADRSVLKASPHKLSRSAEPWGVFATRSPVRPNPIALSTAELLGRDGLTLHVRPLDLLDGTPVVDLKSYSPGWDNVFSATSVRRVPSQLLPDEHLIAFLERDLVNHLGTGAASATSRRVLEVTVRAIRDLDVDPRDPSLAVELSRCDAAIDAVMAMTGACFSNGRLRVQPTDGPAIIRFRRGERELVEEVG